METSLHRQLKEHFAGRAARVEVRVDNYRIDAVAGGRMIEIQHSSLSAIRRKIVNLLESGHRVTVVKPLIARKRLISHESKGGPVTSSRMSPKRETMIDLFHELIRFTEPFNHRRLIMKVPLVEVEELRYPGHGRRRRRREKDFVVEDQRLTEILEIRTLRSRWDVVDLLDPELVDTRSTEPFDTADLAKALDIKRWIAQRIAYTLRHIGAIREIPATGRARVYRWEKRRTKRAA